MTEDDERLARVDRTIGEMESMIALARMTLARMAAHLHGKGIHAGDTLRKFVLSDKCPPELRAMIMEDLADLAETPYLAEPWEGDSAGFPEGQGSGGAGEGEEEARGRPEPEGDSSRVG